MTQTAKSMKGRSNLGSLFTTQVERDEAQRETVRDIPLEEISDFLNQPFTVRMDGLS